MILLDSTAVPGHRWAPSRGARGDAAVATDLGCAKGPQGRTTAVFSGSLSAAWQVLSCVFDGEVIDF